MSIYAKVVNGIVETVIVAEASFFDTFVDDSPGTWILTATDNERTLLPRKNYAGIGHTYDATRDAFISPQPYPSWVLDESDCIWYAPIPEPDIPHIRWDEATTSWKEQD